MLRSQPLAHSRTGYTLIEVTLSAMLFSIVMLGSFTLIDRDTRLAKTTVSIANAEGQALEMLQDVERELAAARGDNPRTNLTASITDGESALMQVGTTIGFPATGSLLLDRGTGFSEIVDYQTFGADLTSFVGLTRGATCSGGSFHGDGTDVLWAGLAEPIEQQTAPTPGQFDGLVRTPTGNLFYRGQGTGFSYRVPTDPLGGNDFLDGDQLQWGSSVGGNPLLTGWAALVFEPRQQLQENAINQDLNQDGDQVDVFEIGQIRRLRWDSENPAQAPEDLGLGPTVILQERCNYGSDLDADGFNDPIFLWDRDRARLQVRLFVVGRGAEGSVVLRQLETSIFLRNAAGI